MSHDAQHWSPRWRRMAVLGDTTLIMYDLHTAYEPSGCSQCIRNRHAEPPALSARRFVVVEFTNMHLCLECGTTLNADDDYTLVHTDDEELAEQRWAEAEAQLLEEAYQ